MPPLRCGRTTKKQATAKADPLRGLQPEKLSNRKTKAKAMKRRVAIAFSPLYLGLMGELWSRFRIARGYGLEGVCGIPAVGAEGASMKLTPLRVPFPRTRS